ncbi:hypothetical protein Csal_2932 [Chromohalobacter israelensis DSM 3043]|uniref:Uncharacterized protein n=1 Tax=Chromohalobacter israelensis (strain ATCC BAA-138 / DSM 3043 / CIP 106854 / NCIMB 13768 / 1H11) TaxID=290398 RepID=Q1QTD1_CHRI1|nr:hypothetical protein Csal_2932 [Chromohalobacter salexigens DSM 3043]
MRRHARERLYDHHAGDDQPQPQKRRQVGFLAVYDDTDQGDQHDPQPRPERIGNPHRQVSQRQRQHVERQGIPHHDGHAGPQARELLGSLQRTGRHDLGDDRDRQKHIHHFGLLKTSRRPSGQGGVGNNWGRCASVTVNRHNV